MAGRERIVHLLRQIEAVTCRCPAHSNAFHQGAATYAVCKTDYAFEMASSNIRYGEGVSREIGMDLQNLGAQNVCLMTDRNLSRLPPVQAVLESLVKNGVGYKVYDNVRVEPTDTSIRLTCPEPVLHCGRGAWDELSVHISVTVSAAERSFSKLKLIKTYQRSTERLSRLVLISINHEVSRQVSCDDAIDALRTCTI